MASPGIGLLIVFSLADFLHLSLFFDFTFAAANVLLWWLARGRGSTPADVFIAWIVGGLSIVAGYWLAGKTGMELLSVAGLFFAGYFVFVGIVGVIMEWNAGWWIGCFTLATFVISILLAVLDYDCGVQHWSVPVIKLVC